VEAKMSVNEQGAKGVEDTGAKGTGIPKVEESDKEKSINSKAKELPWVIDLQKKSAAYDKLVAKQAENKRQVEQEQLEAAGNYEASLEMERSKYKELETKYQKEIKELSLKAEMIGAGLVDSRAIKLFIDDFNPDEESVGDFVAKIKADDKNSLYFSAPKKSLLETPVPGGGGKGQNYDPAWIDSDDPKKREVALQHNRKKAFEDLRAKGILP
jgi:hypothetical protein